MNRLWAEINLDNITHNLDEIRKAVGFNKNCKVMAVVKADAYGHGMVEIASVLVNRGVDRLAVSNLDEALQLRRNGFDIPLHILSHTFCDGAGDIVENDIIQTICDIDLARAVSVYSVKRKKVSSVHIKVDTGMTRLGFPCTEEAIKDIRKIVSMEGIHVEGIMTHLAFADHPDPSYSHDQINAFSKFCNKIESPGCCISMKHMANSAALLRFPESRLNMVRPGLILYGLYPAGFLRSMGIDLKPAMSLKARVVGVKTVPENVTVGYGGIYRTHRESRIITISAGYADGVCRRISGKARVIVNGQYAPVIGNVCMDHFMVDVTEHKSIVAIGDEVTIFGRVQELEITADEIAGHMGTISYEVVCSLGKRVIKVYNSSESYK